MSQIQGVIAAIHDRASEFIAIRHAIHAHPELGFEEESTSQLVAEALRGWGYDVTAGLGGTGVVGQLRCGKGARRLGIRADMDALPIHEETGLPYASRLPGKMHACGHDGHTAILLAAARYLAETRRFHGTLNLIFQPAEEGLGGAERMLAEGLFDRFPCDAVYALHNGPTLPAGSFVVQPGVLAASSDTVTITLTGRGGHGGMPHTCIDPVVAMASLILALQTIVSRNVPPDQAAVLTIGAVHAGAASNVIPDSARLEATVRTFNPAIQQLIEQRLRELVAAQAQSFGVTAQVEWRRVTRVLVNTPEETRLAREVAEAMAGPQGIVPLPAGAMGGDDFSWMLEQVPGCYVVLGNGIGSKGGCMIHNPGYDFNDDILSVGASYWARLTEAYLG
ncbi:M20 aminoacylase family protein [Chromobacterium paludis]|uniref:Amidohydrolase n=1 Tax=Chromobacterium paludis TaxID=2605945 RepID=A0A5C1DFP8_9NEIS|nr:M20 aminoacylase family protein [Chromobacterium paludis]QEL55530.1 amidohydrolase [Chromobacterium paludis]